MVASAEQESTQDMDQRLELRLESSVAAKVLLSLRNLSLSKSELAVLLGHRSISGELNKEVKALLEKQWF